MAGSSEEAEAEAEAGASCLYSPSYPSSPAKPGTALRLRLLRAEDGGGDGCSALKPAKTAAEAEAEAEGAGALL